MKRSGLVLILLFICLHIAAQTRVDSLETALLTLSGEDRLPIISELVWELRYSPSAQCSLYAAEGIQLARQYQRTQVESNLYKDLAVRAFSHSRYDEALQLADTALRLARSGEFISEEAAAHNALGLTHRYMGDLDVALEHFRAAQLLWQQNGSPENRITALGNIGTIEAMRGSYHAALRAFIEVRHLQEASGQTQQLGHTMNNIGTVYEKLEQYDKALQYYRQALDIVLQNKDDRLAAKVFNNLANMYNIRQEFDLALSMHQQNIEVQERLGDKPGLSTTLSNMGNVYDNLNELKKAEEYKLRSLDIKREIGDRSGLAHTLWSLAITYNKMKRYRDAKQLLTEALSIAKERDEKFLSMEIEKDLADVNANMGEYQEAYKYFLAYSTAQDSMLNEQMATRIAEVEARYGNEAMQREIDALRTQREKQNIQRGILIGVMIILAGIVLLQWSLNRHKQHVNQLLTDKNNKIEAQKHELELTLERLRAAYEERQAAHEAIVELERKNSVLALAVTANHEINQPLMVISGNLDLLEMQKDEEKSKLNVQRIRGAIEQIQSILHKLNTMRKVHFKQYSSSTEMVDLDRILESDEQEPCADPADTEQP